MRRALLVGLDDYSNSPLAGCVNDATDLYQLLELNEDGTKNFDVKLVTGGTNGYLANLKASTRELFGSRADVALFYFSGHGTVTHGQAYICPLDSSNDAPGLRLEDLVEWADHSANIIPNRIIILDCCFAGNAGNRALFSETISKALLGHGTTILTASRENELSSECLTENGIHGIFTYLMLDALRGGAADILGRITPAGIYSHVDQSLGSWDQRPLFKTHVDSFLVLRTTKAKVSIDVLRMLPTYFPTPDSHYSLTPEHEHSDSDGNPRTDGNSKLQQEFLDLQFCNRVGLVAPVDEPHMYWAAMHSKSCKLTALGKHYWRLATLKRL